MFKRLLRKSSLFTLVSLLVLLLFMSACQTRQKGRKPSPDWSRAIPVGTLVRGDINLIVDQEEEGYTHLVWLQEEGDRSSVHYLQLNVVAEVLVDRNLELPGDQTRHPHIAETDGPNLHLIWSSRQDGQREWDLWAGQLSPAGDLVGEPIQIASAENNVNDFSITSDGRGGVYIVWESGADGALYGAQIDAAGEISQAPLLMVRQGIAPFVTSDGSDMILVWFDQGDMRYGQWPAGELSEQTGERVATIPLNTGQTLDGPVVGLAGEWAYVIWSVYSSSGMEAGTAVAKYVTFPKDAPTLNTGQTIRLSTAEETPYAPVESAYLISQLAPPASIRESSGLVRHPNPTTARGDELAVAVVSNQERRLDEVIQPALLIFKEGTFTGYQMAGKTEAYSQEPSLAVGAAGSLYMAWREGARGSIAYYALTTAVGQVALDRMSGGDVATTALSGGMEVIAGMLFFPLACIWIFPGLLLIGGLHIWRGDSDMREPLTIILLVLAIIVAQVIKLAFLPTISFYVPFSAWLDVSPRWEDPLRLLVPFLTMGIGFLVALYMRKRNPSALAFFFWFIAVDALLTLAVYGVNFLGVF